jgi:hypothetical protein
MPLLRRVHPALVAGGWSGGQVMVAAALLIVVTAFLVWQRWPLGDDHTFMLLEWQLWPQGAGLFALGVWAGEAGSLEDLTDWHVSSAGPPSPRRPCGRSSPYT